MAPSPVDALTRVATPPPVLYVRRMPLVVRNAVAADSPRIVAISAQIWDGHDYVPDVLGRWLADRRGEVLVAEIDGTVAAFAYRTWLADGHAWLQGIRADPALQGRGAGRALTGELVERCRRDGARRIGLSTYVDNEASIHLIESFGFQRKASFVYLEGPRVTTAEASGNAGGEAVRVSEEELAAFIRQSAFLRVACGRFPSEWRFIELAREPGVALGWAPYRLGVRRGGRLTSALCASYPGRPDQDGAFLSFLEGDPRDAAALLARAADDLEAPSWEAMIPKKSSEEAPALAMLRALGFTSWNAFVEDAFSYELDT